jgi:flagellar protein FliO/FliZ
MLDSLMNFDAPTLVKFAIGVVVVLVLIFLATWVFRRSGRGGVSGSSARGRQPRLAVIDAAAVDARRRLVLIRRDNVEHLILIGGPSDVVVEPNIVRAAPASGTSRPGARPGGFEDDDASIIPEPAPGEPERTPAAPRSSEPPRTMPRPAPQRIDPQYADMAQRLEQALRKPAGELDVPRAPAPAPAASAPRAPAPRAPEPRSVEPAAPPAPRPVHPVQIAQPAQGQQSAADVFGSLEEEMASLLRPGAKKENK